MAGAATHTVSTPVAPTTYTATYQPRTALRAVADAYVYDSAASINTNFGSATELLVKSRGTGFNRESDLRFDLSSVSTIGSAKLRLFGRLQEHAAAERGVWRVRIEQPVVGRVDRHVEQPPGDDDGPARQRDRGRHDGKVVRD